MQPDHIRALFLQELEEQTAALSRGVLALEEQKASREVLDDVFRAAHSLKGAAHVTGARAVADVAHGMESVLGGIREQIVAADAEIVTALLGAIDWLVTAAAVLAAGDEPDGRQARRLRATLNDLAELDDEPPPDGPADEGSVAVASHEPADDTASHQPADEAEALPAEAAERYTPKPAKGAETVRVAAAKLDALLRQASEVSVARQRLEAMKRDVTLAASAIADHDAHWRRLRGMLRSDGCTVAAEVAAAADRADASWRATAAAVEPLAATSAAVERELRQAAAPLVDKVLDLRTVAFGEVCAGLDRVARDAARRAAKDVVLTVDGGTVELDRSVALALREPLIHLIHNAVDHGIETPAARLNAGKGAVGHVTVSAQLRAQRVEVVVRDDGAGLHRDAIRAAAARTGFGDVADAEGLVAAVFTPGFTTAAEVTESSGRGVGLDAVRARIDGLGGSVGLVSKAGTGTTVTLVAPITLSILHTISVAVGDQVVMLSSPGVQRAVHVRRSDIRSVGGWPTLVVEDRRIPMVDLAQVLGWPSDEAPADGGVATLLVDVAGTYVGLTVSALLGEGEATVHSIGERIGAAPAVVGVSLLPQGGIAVILSALACARLGLATSPSRTLHGVHSAPARAIAPRVLLAEDTMTTRALEQGLLEAAGYEVIAAVDGADAWRQLQERGADVVVSDVNMPRMDGLELCAAIRESRRFSDLPVVLVTSLADEDDRRRGSEAGANAYIVKSGFDKGVLLDTLERLLR